jgi:hypothetical protein
MDLWFYDSISMEFRLIFVSREVLPYVDYIEKFMILEWQHGHKFQN